MGWDGPQGKPPQAVSTAEPSVSAKPKRPAGRCAGHWQQAIKEIIWYYLNVFANFCPVYAGQFLLRQNALIFRSIWKWT